MKNLLFKSSFVLFLLFTTSVSFAQSAKNDNNNLVGKARGAAATCLTEYIQQGFAIASQVETTGICFVSGELKKVSFYTTVRCNTQPCPRPYSILIATVYFDCEGNVTSVECGK